MPGAPASRPRPRSAGPVPRERSDALVLRTFDFGESDRIVHLLTRRLGRVSAIAKGARRSRRRFPGTLDVLNRLDVEWVPARRGGMARLEQARLLTPFGGLRRLPERFALACYLVELLDRLATEGGPARDSAALHDFAVSALACLETARPDPCLRVLLELRTLDALGLRPELETCVRCGRAPRAARVAVHVGEGGALCEACARPDDATLRVGLGTLRALAGSRAFPAERLTRVSLGPRALAEACELVERLRRYHVGVELRSERFLNEILPRAGARTA